MTQKPGSDTQLSVQELLKPRYKVIADWPGVAGKVCVGDIIISDGATNGFWVAGDPFQEDKLNDYPHLFKKLQWFEERKPEEMPEYVKYWDTSFYFPIDRICKTSEAPFKDTWTSSNFLPATKEEYEQFQNQKS